MTLVENDEMLEKVIPPASKVRLLFFQLLDTKFGNKCFATFQSTLNGTKHGNGLNKSYSFDDSEESHHSSSYRNGRESHPKVSNFSSDDFKFSDLDSNLDYKTTDLGYSSRAPRYGNLNFGLYIPKE